MFTLQERFKPLLQAEFPGYKILVFRIGHGAQGSGLVVHRHDIDRELTHRRRYIFHRFT